MSLRASLRMHYAYFSFLHLPVSIFLSVKQNLNERSAIFSITPSGLHDFDPALFPLIRYVCAQHGVVFEYLVISFFYN